MTNGNWRTRTRGTKRQRGKKFKLDKDSLQKRKARLKRIRAKRRGRSTLKLFYVDYKDADVWGLPNAVQIEAKSRDGAIKQAKEMGIKNIFGARYVQMVKAKDKAINGIAEDTKAKIVERAERGDYTYYRWDTGAWLMVQEREDDEDECNFHVKGEEEDVKRLARTLHRICAKKGYDGAILDGGDKKIGKKVEELLGEMWEDEE